MTRTRCLFVAIAMAAIVGPSLCTSASAQTLVSKKGKVRVFKGTLTVEGRNLEVNGESVSLSVGGQTTFLDLRDIDRVDVREGNAAKGACIGGGGCMAIGMLACTASSEEDLSSAGGSRGQCYAGTMVWSALFAGLGALVGNASSDWETVYYRSSADLEGEGVVRSSETSRPERRRLWLAVVPPRDCCSGVVGLGVTF